MSLAPSLRPLVQSAGFSRPHLRRPFFEGSFGGVLVVLSSPSPRFDDLVPQRPEMPTDTAPAPCGAHFYT